MGRGALLGWSLFGIYIAMTVIEFWQMFDPNLTARSPAEHVFHPSWGARREGSVDQSRAQRYGLKLCVAARETQIEAAELANQCIYAREDLSLNDTLDVQFNFTLPPRYLTPFVLLQERYISLHQQLHDEEQRQALQDQQRSDVAPGVGVSAVTAAIMEQLKEVRQELQSSGLFLHSFLYRIDAHTAATTASSPLVLQHTAAMKADPWHVHQSTALLVRRLVDQNQTRNLLSGDVDGGGDSHTQSNASSVSAGPPRKHLIHFLRPRLNIQFMSGDTSFPASRVPHDLVAYFPKRGAPAAQRKYYPPLVRVQDMLLLRREWRALNRSVLEQAEQDEAAAEAAAEASAGGGEGALRRATPRVMEGSDAAEGAVFTTTPTSQPGVSDAAPPALVASSSPSAAAAAAAADVAQSATSVTVSLRAVSLGWFRLLNQMSHSMNLLAEVQSSLSIDPSAALSRRGGLAQQLHRLRSHDGMEQDAMGKELEDVKTIFVDSNPLLLLLTLVISVVHLVLDMLAFRSDVSFWRSRKGNYAGISSRSLLLSTLVRAVLFLYLLDQDASWLVLFSSGLSLAISVWKCAKILRLQVGCSARFPFLSVSLGGHHSASESLTAQHDAAAMKWLGMLAAPLVLGCTVWSLVYQSHKSWYSWGLSSCALAVHAGGFILMTPQLFVNYKLKSVAHLPLRVFIYRACNTFIDDIFSFLIPMPTMHRLACFRDDVIFFVYLYQRWIYPTDHSRTIKADTDDDQRAEGKSGGEGQTPQPVSAQGEALPLPLLAATADDAAEKSKDESSAAPPAAAATTAGDSDVDVAPDATSSTAEGAAESVLTRRHAAATAAAAASD